MAKPYRLDGEAAPAPLPRDTTGRFARPSATPANPLSESKPAANDQQTMSGWAPGIGQGSAEIRKGNIPWPAVTKADSAGKE